MSEKRLFLIDATAFCYRAFYALPALSTSFGQPTNALYGFLLMFQRLMKEHAPEYVAACFDVSRDTFRQKKFAEYKMQRPPTPDELSSQIPLIKEITASYGVRILEKEGFEADDVIATLCHKAQESDFFVTIVSSDKDLLQLVNGRVSVLSPGKDKDTVYDSAKVFERFGVLPEQIPGIMALMGDSADNIPNVPGIGEKTAAGLIKEFGSLDKLLLRRDEIKKEKLKRSLYDHEVQIRLNKELIALEEKVELSLGLEDLKVNPADYNALFGFFKRYEFKRFLKDLPAGAAGSSGQSELFKDECVALSSDAELAHLNQSFDNVIVGIESLRKINLLIGGQVFELDALGIFSRGILADPKIKKIGHDLKKIKVLLAREGIEFRGMYFDTMIAAYLVNPSSSGYSLADIAWNFLGEHVGEAPLNSIRSLKLIERLQGKLTQELKDKDLGALFHDLEVPLIDVLAEMEINGIMLDTGLLKSLSRDIEKRLIILIESIYALSGTQFNINSPKQLREILFERLKLPVGRRSKTGPSTDEEVLRSLAGLHKLPAFLLEYRQLVKLKTTYIDALPALIDSKTGRVHTSFNQAVTETGRLSSSNPNLQNIPIKTDIGKNIRRSFIASGNKSLLLSCDYSQVELRILAHLSQDENLIAAFQTDKDIHRATAALIYGLDESQIEDKQREMAKRVNFGIVYGQTAFGLSRDLSISFGEAQAFIDAYFLRYPKVKEYIAEEIVRARRDGFVVTMLGRRRYIPEINNKNQGLRQFAERQAVNTPIQGSASDLIKLAMVKIYEEIHRKQLKAQMIMQIHDELVFDVPLDEMAKVIDLIRDKMEHVFTLRVPVVVTIKKGKNWLEMEDMA